MAQLIWPTMAAAQAQARRITVAPLAWDPANLLLSRCGFGPTQETRAQVQQGGPDAWYAAQVTAGATYAGYQGLPQVAGQFPLLAMTPYDTRIALGKAGNQYGWTAMDQLTRMTIALQAWSPAQLYEVLVDVFSNHLNVPNHNGDMWVTRHCYDRDVIRPNVMGSFTQMLLASSKHPAMLTYLSLGDSTKDALNENYGRELLELHTVGRIYSEDDVKNAARMLTGRTYDRNYHYIFDDYVHDTNPVTVLGYTHPNGSALGGEKAGDDMLRYLAAHKSTAQNLAQKLCVRLVSDSPSPELVAAVAKAYLDHRTQILPMVSTILRSTEFWESRGKKTRRPAENVMASLRTLNISVTDWNSALGTLHWVTRTMGHTPLEWPAPNGYPMPATAWRSTATLLNVWDKHLGLSGGWWDGFSDPDLLAFYGAAATTTSGEAVAAMAQRLTGQPWAAADLAALQTFLGEPGTTTMARSVLRWWGPYLAAVILDAPHFALC